MVELPRYKLPIGRRLTYRLSDEFIRQEPESGARTCSRSSIEWDVYVIARHADGSSRVLFSESRTQESGSHSGESTARTFACDAFFDIGNDGRLIENWTITPLANPAVIFPPLPQDQTQLLSGWKSNLHLDGTIRRYMPSTSNAAANPPMWQFAENCQTQLDPVYLASRRREYTFDLDRGLVARVTTAFERGWPAGAKSASSDVIDLIDVSEHADADPRPLAQEAERYFEACAEYQRLIDLAQWDLPQANHWQRQAADVLEQFELAARSEPIEQWVRRKLKLHNDECGSMLADAEHHAHAIDQPAPEWQAVDLTGKTLHSEDFRGSVLVLCFWNRGCPWAVRALLALNTSAVEMRVHPIAFLGVGADRDLESAAFVWQTLNISFPTVMDLDDGHPIASAYGVDGHPTTVVIDRFGHIRRIRVGYSYSLSSTLAPELMRLVNEHPACPL